MAKKKNEDLEFMIDDLKKYVGVLKSSRSKSAGYSDPISKAVESGGHNVYDMVISSLEAMIKRHERYI